MNEISFALLIIFSALSMNPVLQCALGISGVAAVKNPDKRTVIIKMGIIFTAVILLWIFFSVIFSSVISGMVIYVLIFPAGYMVYEGLDFLFFKYILKRDSREPSSVGFAGGITALALFICVNLAGSIIQALALAFGFAGGALLALIILSEIQKRASLEVIPEFLRGKPLLLISMGMLSLVFSTVSVLIFRIIGNG